MAETITVGRKIAPPTPTPDTEVYWKAAAEGRFMLRRCTSCQKTHWYPRPICPHCMGDATDWFEAEGTGTIYSYTIMRRVPEPYCIAYVTLAEGPTMMTNIVGCDLEGIRIGQKVTLAWAATVGGPPVPCFTPA